MNKIVILLFCILTFLSCKKDQSALSDFSGSWELEKTMNMSGVVNHPPGNGQTMYLGADGMFEKRPGGLVTFHGRYYLEFKEDCDGNVKHTMFRSTESSAEYRIRKEGTSLVLSSSSCYADGGTAWYRPIP